MCAHDVLCLGLHSQDKMTALDHTSTPLVEIRAFLEKSWREQNPELWAQQKRNAAAGIKDEARPFYRLCVE